MRLAFPFVSLLAIPNPSYFTENFFAFLCYLLYSREEWMELKELPKFYISSSARRWGPMAMTPGRVHQLEKVSET